MTIKKVFRILEKNHPLTMLEELGHYTPFQLLVMTMLSARTKDSTVIPIVKEMFKKYPSPSDFVSMDVLQLEKMIYKIGFYRVKAKNLKLLSKMLIENFNGKVPETLEELTSLPGVGRKTANCILNYALGKPAVAVDVHVFRIANRLGWIKTKNAEESEFALQKVVPHDEWINVNKLLVGHGQSICSPINPKCNLCNVKKLCKFGKDL
jgi:endonuclease III